MRQLLILAVCTTVLVATQPIAADDPAAPAKKEAVAPALPTAWHGVWKGRCTVDGPKRKRLGFPMELHVGPIEGREAWTWTIVYGEGAQRQVRPYELLPVEGEKGHFRVDEKNGIVIDAWLHGGTLYSRFEIGKVSIAARYTLRGKQLDVALTTTSAAPVATTGGKDGIPPVKAFRFVALQSGTLSRTP